MEKRVIALDGIHNLRDYGGYAGRDNARLKAGLLWRSSQHLEATPDDLDAIASLNLRTVVDLRGSSERSSFPCPRPEGFAAQLVHVDGETMGHAPHVEAGRDVRTPDEALEALNHSYSEMPYRPRMVDAYRLYFEALAERPGASLVHCLAGKDRTGVAVALVHHLLGVHWDDIMADYLLTNSAGNIDRRIAAGAAVVRQNFGAAMSDDALRMLMSVQPKWLETAFASIRDRDGTVRDYAESRLGVTPDRLRKIEDNLLG